MQQVIQRGARWRGAVAWRVPPVTGFSTPLLLAHAEGQGIDLDNDDDSHVAVAIRPPAAVLAMDDTGAMP